jgi:hypothetical protein
VNTQPKTQIVGGKQVETKINITRTYTDAFNGVALTLPGNQVAKLATISKNTAALSWIAAVNATEIKIEQSSDNGITWSAATTEQPVTVESNKAVVTGLSANTSYKFRVKVTGGLNAGISNVVTVIAADPLLPAKK